MRKKMRSYYEAVRLTVLITRRPWWDKDDPWCNIALPHAWQIASDIWLKD